MIPLPRNFSVAPSSSLPLGAERHAHASLATEDANVAAVAKQALEKISSINDFKTPFQQDAGSAFTGAASSAVDVSSDFSAILRTLPDVKASSFNSSTPLFPIMGMTTGFNSVQGSVAALQAKERYEKMDSAGAAPQKTDAAIDYVRGLAQAGGGISFAANRPLSVASTITNASTSSLLGRATLYTGSIGSALFGVFYASLGALSGRQIFRLKNFENKMDQYGSTDAEKARFLIEKRLQKKSPEETLLKLITSHNAYKARQILQNRALSAVEKSSSSLVKDAAKNGIDTHGMVKGEGKKYAAKVFEALNEDRDVKTRILERMGLTGCQEAKGLSPQELMGLELMCEARNQKKEIKLSECIGPNATALAKNAIETRLLERLNSEDSFVKSAAEKEAEALVSEAKKGIQSNKKMSWAVFCTCVLGVLSTVAGFLPLVGIALAVEQFVNLGIYLSMLAIDWTGLKSAQQVESGPIGKHDKLLLSVNTAICMGALAATLIVGSIFSMGILPMAAAAAIGAVWLVNNISAYAKLEKKERAYKEAHPTLSDVKDVLSKQQGRIDDATKALLKRLSISDKKAVKKHLLGKDSLDTRALSDEDQKLDIHHCFGEEFAYANPKDPAVLRAAEKAFIETRSLAIRGLIDRLHAHVDEKDLKSYIQTQLTEDDKTALFKHVYNKRARKESSKAFENAEVKDISKAINSVIDENQKNNEEFFKKELTTQLQQLKILLG